MVTFEWSSPFLSSSLDLSYSVLPSHNHHSYVLFDPKTGVFLMLFFRNIRSENKRVFVVSLMNLWCSASSTTHGLASDTPKPRHLQPRTTCDDIICNGAMLQCTEKPLFSYLVYFKSDGSRQRPTLLKRCHRSATRGPIGALKL